MIVAPAAAALFFKLMLPLQHFANIELGVLPQANSLEKYIKTSMTEKFAVRNALFKNVRLIDEFIDRNPHDIPMKELTIVARWKNFVSGDFFIERYLKDYAAFIDDDEQVFAVRGLTETFTANFPKFTLPIRLNALLLPFLDKIVADGFFLPQRIAFGGDIKSELKEIYLEAKRKDRIVERF